MRQHARPVLAVCAALAALALPAPVLAQKSLRWPEVAVRARLDAEGTLHVAERLTMRFNGDWNGGYRTFRRGIGRLHLERLARIDAAGREIPLAAGDLDEVDHYEWKDFSSLRWRSRRASDPPFENATLVYEIDYTLAGVVWKSGGLYHLDHNFVFPDRTEEIDHFILDLTLDPAWRPTAAVPGHLERTALPPGEDVIVRSDLEYQGGAAPAGARAAPPAVLRFAFLTAALVAMAWLYFRFRDGEAALGRWQKPDIPEPPGAAWLQENVFCYLPEEVGALWDRKVGPPEVAATLARLVAEGKLTSQVVPARQVLGLVQIGDDALRLRRVAPTSDLTGYERTLIDRIFFGSRTEVDTNEVRAHYKSTGFDPAGAIREGLEQRLAGHSELQGKTPPPPRRPTLFLVLAVAALLALEGVPALAGRTVNLTLVVPAVCLALYVPGLIAAFRWRDRTERLDAGSFTFLGPALGIFLLGLGAAFFNDLFPASGGVLLPGFFGCLGLALLPVAALNSLLNNARSRETAETIRRRQVLAAARHYFQRELRRPQPALRDEWFPYLLAFGLNQEVDRWFRAFAGPSRHTEGYVGGIGGGGGGGWTGGGGTFGGAGASASWTTAASHFAAGVPAPSSSGSGGGGGGGSSGGGGGGGW